MRLIASLGLVALHTAVVVIVVAAARELPAGGDIIAFSASGGATQDIFLQDVSRGLLRNLTSFTGSHHETQPAWSPDGTQIAFVASADSYAPTDIYVMDMDGRRLRQLTKSVSSEFGPTWSPDGSQIAFVYYGNTAIATLYRMDANGDNVQQMTNGTTGDVSPAWSPDGSSIAYYSLRRDGRGLYIMEMEGHEERLVAWSGNPTHAWSPDGSQIAFIVDGTIQLLDIESGDIEQLDTPGTQSALTWLSDGNRLVYLSYPCALCDPAIYMRDMDNGEEHLFAGGAYGSALPAWRPG